MSQMGESNGLSNAGISPKERLERIEAMLEKIDGKLDNKADISHVATIESRLLQIELAGSRTAGDAVVEVKAVKASTRTDLDLLRTDLARVKLRLAYYAGALGAASIALQVALAKGWI